MKAGELNSEAKTSHSRRGLRRQNHLPKFFEDDANEEDARARLSLTAFVWSHSLHHELELTTDTTQERKNEHCLLPAAGLELRDARRIAG